MVSTSVIVIPIHDKMFVSLKDVPEGRLSKKDIARFKRTLKGHSFEAIERMLAQSGYPDNVSVGRIKESD